MFLQQVSTRLHRNSDRPRVPEERREQANEDSMQHEGLGRNGGGDEAGARGQRAAAVGEDTGTWRIRFEECPGEGPCPEAREMPAGFLPRRNGCSFQVAPSRSSLDSAFPSFRIMAQRSCTTPLRHPSKHKSNRHYYGQQSGAQHPSLTLGCCAPITATRLLIVRRDGGSLAAQRVAVAMEPVVTHLGVLNVLVDESTGVELPVGVDSTKKL
jgi:hypothetical protein